MESKPFRPRHDLDILRQNATIDARPATPAELPAMVALARKAVPGVAIADAAVERVFRHHPECIFPFRSGGRILGGIAFLHLNEDGLIRLLLDQIDFADPAPEILALPGEPPAAMYVWALAAHGRGTGGIGNVSSYLRAELYTRSDYYAQPSTAEGRRLLGHLGFIPTTSFHRELWVYRRKTAAYAQARDPLLRVA